jgi:hypothetical protein
VGRGADRDELRALVAAALAARLKPAGWVLLDRPRPHRVAELVRSLDNGFEATVAVTCGEGSLRLPVLIDHVFAGVSYEPLRRLAPLLGDEFGLAFWHEEIDDELERPADDGCLFEVASPADVEAVADRLAALILERGEAFARQYPSVDALLAECRDDHDEPLYGTKASALLAAAGRWDEARDALQRSGPEDGDREEDREDRRFARQLTRYIDSGGDPELVPNQPPPSPYVISPGKSVGEIWRRARARDEAVNAIRRLDPATPRDDLRAALERELAIRGLNETPLWYEQTLDDLHLSSTEQTERFAKGLTAAVRLGFKAVRALREHRPIPDLSAPAWLDGPDRAAYPVQQNHDANWTAVQLDPDARAWLDTAYAAVPRLIGATSSATAWLAWEDTEQARLVVHLGDERVGTLDAAATESYRPTMRLAAQTDELPYTAVHLTPRPTTVGYLLELQLPSRTPSA